MGRLGGLLNPQERHLFRNIWKGKVSQANDRCCVTSTLWGLLSCCREDPRPLSNPHYIWANVGNEDVRVIKHHRGPSLYKNRNTLSGIVLHLKDKCIGQRISSILVAVPYCAPCATESGQVASWPLDGSLGVPHGFFFLFLFWVLFIGECWPNARQRADIWQLIKLYLGAELDNTIYF